MSFANTTWSSMRRPRRFIVFLAALLLLLFGGAAAVARGASADVEPRWSVRMADATIARAPKGYTLEQDAAAEPKWSYSTAFAVYAVGQVGVRKGDQKYLDYCRRYAELFVGRDGSIKTP